MGSKIIYFVFLPIAILVLTYGIVHDVDYYLTNKSTICKVVEIKEKYKREVIITYFNSYKGENTTGKFSTGYKTGNEINTGDEIEIVYQKIFPSIYNKYKKPPTYLSLLIYVIPLFLVLYLGYKKIRVKKTGKG